MSRTLTGARERASAVAHGLAERFTRLLKSADRLDALDGRTGALTSDELRADPAARSAVARELVARLLRVASDGHLEPLVRALVRDGAQKMDTLAASERVTRFVLGRRVDDLVDAGLVERDLGPDILSPTALAAAFVDLLDELESATAREMGERLGGGH